jgi:hypothetical protein
MRENNVVQLRRNWSPLKLGNKGIEVLKAGRLAAFFFFEENADCNALFSLQPGSLINEPTHAYKDNSGSTQWQQLTEMLS